MREHSRPTLLLLLLLALTWSASVSHAKESGDQILHSARKLQCLTAPATPSRLPKLLPVGVETIHRDAKKIITIFVPLAPEGQPSKVLDSNARGQRLPERFVLSDGTVRTAFVGVDRSPGSRLDLCLSEILRKTPSSQPEKVYLFIKNQLQRAYLRQPPAHHVFAWDRGRKPAPELMEYFHAAKDLEVGHYPLRTLQKQDVVPLEDFLEAGYGTCLHKALLASLLLAKLGIPHRLVNGASQAEGHTWIELEDGRILDPSLQELAKPAASRVFTGWIRYGKNTVFENQVWPFLELD